MSHTAPLNNPALYHALHHALAQGIALLDTNQQPYHAPLTRYPSAFLQSAFQQAVDLAPLFNQVINRVAQHDTFLTEVLQTTETDAFSAQLGQIYTQIQTEGISQPTQLGLFRSDYFMHQEPTDNRIDNWVLRQIEFNTIAAAFAGLSPEVTRWHQLLTQHPAGLLPDNLALQGFVLALTTAWQIYGVDTAVICCIVQPNERNRFDQYKLEAALWHHAGIRVRYKTLEQLYEATHLRHNRLILTDGGDEVAVAYYRSGYTPKDYPTPQAWAARLRIERSNAIKCPSIHYHLSGLKTVQSRLTQPEILAQLVPEAKQRQRLQACFAQFYALDSPTVQQQVQAAPEQFVLKPQREGGGNNYYDKEIIAQLHRLSPQQQTAWVLMQRLNPPTTRNQLLQQGVCSEEMAVVSELGIFAVCLAQGDTLLLNQAAGHLLRTKPATALEGGVAAGFAALDSPLLVAQMPERPV